MQVIINIKKSYLYGFLAGLIVILGALMVSAFGGSNPAVMGHSALELIVNSSSIVDGSIVNADVNSAAAIDGSKISAASLSGTAAGLNIGGNAATATAASNSNACSNDGTCDVSTVGFGGLGSMFGTAPSSQLQISSSLVVSDTNDQPNLALFGGTGKLGVEDVFIVGESAADMVLFADANSDVITIRNGGNAVVRCTSAGALPAGALTTDGASCGSSTDTGLRVV